MNEVAAAGIFALDYYDKGNHRLYEKAQPTKSTDSQDHLSVVCSECGAVYLKNHWTWGTRPQESCETLCPACLRIRDRMPAAILTVRGDCLTEHREEILGLIRNQVKKIGKHHPLKRIMDMESDDTEAVFTFTDEQLTREIGDALHKAFDGVLDFQYSNEDTVLRVVWQR